MRSSVIYNEGMLIDTHCHLHDLEWFTPEQQIDFLDSAHSHDVEKIICIGTNHEDSLNARDFALPHDGVYWTYGIHPEFANQPGLSVMSEALSFWESPEATAEDEAARHPQRRAGATACPKKINDPDITEKLVAIGEIGLDYHYDGYDRIAQIKLFEQMLQLAVDNDLPVSMHIREAFPDAFAIIDNFPQIKGVVHSFTGSKRQLCQALERGLYIGVNGLATYSTLPMPPLERIVLETDAPFLTPVPFRGTINKPEYVQQVAAYLAEKLGVAEVNIVEQTTQNARQLFQI